MSFVAASVQKSRSQDWHILINEKKKIINECHQLGMMDGEVKYGPKGHGKGF